MSAGKPARPAGIGLYGGTFDPIHTAHLRLARALRDELALDSVRLIPSGVPPHRPPPHASADHRLAMARLAVTGEPGLDVDARELTPGASGYTVDTLAALRREVGPTLPLWWLIGADQLAGLERWHRWQDLLTLANLAVAARPGFGSLPLPPAVDALWQSRQATDFANFPAAGRIRALTLSPVDVSATAIRADLAAGGDGLGALPPAVLGYIRRHRLYRIESI